MDESPNPQADTVLPVRLRPLAKTAQAGRQGVVSVEPQDGPTYQPLRVRDQQADAAGQGARQTAQAEVQREALVQQADPNFWPHLQ